MITRWRSVALLSALLLASGAGCKREPRRAPQAVTKPVSAAAPMTAAQLIEAAIAATGGLEQLRAASSHTYKSRLTLLGVPLDTVSRYRPGYARADFTSPLGQPVTRVESIDDCWAKRGPAVVPCMPGMKNSIALQHQLYRLAWLWPLKADEGWKLTVGKTKIAGKERDTLGVEKGDLRGTLFFDPETHLFTGFSGEADPMGTKGRFEVWFSEHEEHCGVKIATRMFGSFNGRVLAEEKTSGYACGPQEDAIFARPEQVKDGTVVLQELPASAAICLLHKGPHADLGPKVGQLFGYVTQKSKVPTVGSPLMIYRVAPPAAKDPQAFETEVCFRMAKDPGPLPAPFRAHQFEKTAALVAYGVGEMAATSKRLAGLLLAGAKQRRRAPSGPLQQVAHMSPQHFPPAELLVELQLPVK